MMRSIAVTGGTGFIGQHLVSELLERKIPMRALVRGQSLHRLEESPELIRVTGDVHDANALDRLVEGAGTIIHLAGATRARSRREFHRVNEGGVRRLIHALERRHAEPPRVILVSSLAAGAPDISPYAASKAAGEQILLDSGDRYDWTIIRPPAVYGPGDTEILAVVKAVASGIAPSIGPSGNRVSMIHVADLVDAILTIADAEETRHRIVEVDDFSEEGYLVDEIVARMASHFERKTRQLPVPRAALLALGAANQALSVLTRRPAMLTIGKAKELSRGDWVCEDRSLIQSLGWSPRIPLAEGLAETIRWYREQGLV